MRRCYKAVWCKVGTGLTSSPCLHNYLRLWTVNSKGHGYFTNLHHLQKKEARTLTVPIQDFVNTKCLRCYNEGSLQISYQGAEKEWRRGNVPGNYNSFKGSKSTLENFSELRDLTFAWDGPLFPRKGTGLPTWSFVHSIQRQHHFNSPKAKHVLSLKSSK